MLSRLLPVRISSLWVVLYQSRAKSQAKFYPHSASYQVVIQSRRLRGLALGLGREGSSQAFDVMTVFGVALKVAVHHSHQTLPGWAVEVLALATH